MIRVDTSVLIDYLIGIQNRAVAAFDKILESGTPYGINEFIYLEVLQGARTAKEYQKLQEYFETIPFYPLNLISGPRLKRRATKSCRLSSIMKKILKELPRNWLNRAWSLPAFRWFLTYRAYEFARLAARARQLGFSGHICAGGHFAALNAENLLQEESAFDSVVCGEGERIMLDLTTSLADLSTVRGLV
jgi:hypothetical protein